ncbi:MAG: TRAP transporter permease, partial [Sutterellaceae bacterium]|nr:TRAP transporter permease [Burkholderiaceae bacterium]MDW8430695.1 TRAP transporter permease [Sutterellaceae bacterium]
MSPADDLQAPAQGPLPRHIFAVAVAFSAFQIVTAAFSPLSSVVVRAIHVGFLLLMTFLLFPPLRRRWLGALLGAAAFAAGLYHWIFEAELVARAGELTVGDWIVGTVTIVLVFEAARRVMGIALPIICALFLAYALFGQHLPGALA